MTLTSARTSRDPCDISMLTRPIQVSKVSKVVLCQYTDTSFISDDPEEANCDIVSTSSSMATADRN